MSFILKPYQKKGVKELVKRKYLVLTDEMGIGKTGQALKAVEALYKKGLIVIIIPAYLKPKWEEEITNWTPKLKEKIIIISYTSLKKLPSLVGSKKVTHIIFDEADNLKNEHALKTTYAMALCNQTKPISIFFLSGTIVRNRFRDVFVPFSICANFLAMEQKDLVKKKPKCKKTSTKALKLSLIHISEPTRPY